MHYCVTNMPAIVPHTSTFALTNATFQYALQLADRGFAAALREDPALRRAVNTCGGKLTHAAVAEAVGIPYTELEAAAAPPQGTGTG